MGVKLTEQEYIKELETKINVLCNRLAQVKANLEFLAIQLDIDLDDEEENNENE